jgi:hypothetical protein
MRALLPVIVVIASATNGAAQTTSAGVLVQTYSFAESEELRLQSLRLLTVPFAGRVSLDDVGFTVSGAYADASMTIATGERSTIGGLTDTRVSADLSVGSLLLSASALVGTGDVVATEQEAVLVGLLSTDLFPFAVNQWGTGGGFAGDVSYTARLGEATVSAGVGAAITAETKPLSPIFVYQPGREIRGRVTLETPVGAAGVASLALGAQQFAADTYDGRNLYRPGARWEAAASYAFPVGPRESALVFGAMSRIDGGVAEVATYHLDYRGFSQAVDDRPGRTTFRMGAEMRLTRGRVAFVPRADVRALRREDGLAQGWIGSLGGAAEIALAHSGYRRALVAQPIVNVRVGTLTATDAIESSVVGWEVGLLLRWSRDP